MIELSPLERDILNNKPSDKARAEMQKAELDADKQAKLDAIKAAKIEQQHKVLADDQAAGAAKQIEADIAQLFEPLTQYTPPRAALNEHSLLMHLRHREQSQAITQQRNDLEQALIGIAQRIDALETEKAELAVKLRQSGQDPETLGRIGVIIMDLDVLAGIKQKYADKLASLPDIGIDYGEQGWLESVANANETALLDAVKACEAVIRGALVKLYLLNPRKYVNYMRVVSLERK